MSTRKWITGIALSAAAALALGGLTSAQAFAQNTPSGTGTGQAVNGSGQNRATISVTPVNNLDPVGENTVMVRGTGFPADRNGRFYPGVYLLFGKIVHQNPSDQGSWAPSKGGRSGVNYTFAGGGDEGARGEQRFIATAANMRTRAAAHAVMDRQGGFSIDLKIFGSTFDVEGSPAVDCLAENVTCGVFTIGAHGQVHAGAETFTPITFAPPPPPTVQTQPSDVTVTEGSDAKFSVRALSTPRPTIQWQMRQNTTDQWTDLPNSNVEEWTVSRVTAAHNGRQYRAVLSRGGSRTESNPATLTVTPAPTNRLTTPPPATTPATPPATPPAQPATTAPTPRTQTAQVQRRTPRAAEQRLASTGHTLAPAAWLATLFALAGTATLVIRRKHA